MNLPAGRLEKSRVVADPRDTLAEALDRAFTGYAVFESQDALLLDAEGQGVVVFEEGVPTRAYHTGTERGGPPALADLAVPGPYHVAMHATAQSALPNATADEIPPGMAAERLAGDPALARSTRRASPADQSAPATHGEDDSTAASPQGAVEAFLENEAKIEAIREQARTEAQERAEEWDL
ncbi:hypothetical protein [Haloarcula pelagica]|uniref:hypothetical protein n=1 Tax=Haloarcula pelagica TaxID=3033389 RepID=UPI0024C3E41C|nr:hypothetical protein [Halomicroarcula sp. YJ-61-S]